MAATETDGTTGFGARLLRSVRRGAAAKHDCDINRRDNGARGEIVLLVTERCFRRIGGTSSPFLRFSGLIFGENGKNAYLCRAISTQKKIGEKPNHFVLSPQTENFQTSI